jgi:hypothetical protein
MKMFFLLVTSLALAGFAAPTSALHLEVKCLECGSDTGSRIESAFRTALARHGFRYVDSSVRAPTLRVVAVVDSGLWFLAPTVYSPRGVAVSVSREEFPGGFTELLGSGVDSALAVVRRVVDEAVQRSKEVPRPR